MSDSEPGFYRQLSLLRNKANWRFTEGYDQPPVRRFSRHWDRNRSELGFWGDREIEVGLLVTSDHLAAP